jgi:PAS domain S-box-containing protein
MKHNIPSKIFLLYLFGPELIHRIDNAGHEMITLDNHIYWERFDALFNETNCHEIGRQHLNTSLVVFIHYLKCTLNLNCFQCATTCRDKFKLNEVKMELELFSILAEMSPFSVSLTRLADGLILKVNKRFCEQSGYLEENVIGRTSVELGLWLDPTQRFKAIQAIQKHGRLFSWPVKFRLRNGEIRDFSYSAQLVEYNGMQCSLGASIETRDQRFREEILTEKDKKISEMESQLQDYNTALRVLSRHYESEKNDQYNKLLTIIEKSVLPYLEKLKVGKIDSVSQTYLSIMESNLIGILSSINQSSPDRFDNLTITEKQVTDLIRQGKSSKEIATLLNVSTAAIAFHRNNIRKKLGLTNRKKSLNSYLTNIME